MATELVKKDSSIFKLLDKEDEKQIVNVKDFANDSPLIYKVHKNFELSYRGIKHIAILMADRGMPLKLVNSKVDLIGEGKEKTWYASVVMRNEKTWYASVVMRNEKTGQEMEGVSQCSFYDEKGSDEFARTKAHSKAERNAIRKLIPEYLITKFIQEADKSQVKEIQFCSCLKSIPEPLAKEICKTCKKVIRQ